MRRAAAALRNSLTIGTENSAHSAAGMRGSDFQGKRAVDTVYSLSGEVPPLEAAALDSDASVLQPGAVVAGSVRQMCFIRKIAAGGAVLHADVPLEEGRRLELELETGEQLDGTIVWRHGSEIGLRFDEAIDILPILARNLASQPGERRRMPRVEVDCQTLIEADTRSGVARIHDIAQGGVKLEAPFALATDERVLLVPQGLRPIEAVVRWADGGLAGIAFDPELSWEELMPWLRAQRGVAAARPAAAPLPSRPIQPPVPGGDRSGSVQLNLPARVREGTRRWSIDVTSLDSRSVQFECYSALPLGTLLWIVLPGLEGWPARIVAIQGYRFTCEFTQPLHPAVLERILAAARGEERP